VLSTIEFDNDPPVETDKVDDVWAERLLPSEFAVEELSFA